MSGILITVAVLFAAMVIMIAWCFVMTPTRSHLEAAKRARLDAIRAREIRADYELNQAAFAARRAILEILRTASRNRDS